MNTNSIYTTNNYIVFDLETNNLNSKLAEIIEISALKIENGLITDTFDSLIRPNNSIPKEITNLTGITDDMVLCSPYIADLLPAFIEFIGDFTLVGHNITTFDLPILRRHCFDILNFELVNNHIDTLYLARNKLCLASYSLSCISGHFGIDYSAAHRSMVDCRITNECYLRLSGLPDLISKPSNSSSNSSIKKCKRSGFSEETKALQELRGFLLGIISDNQLLDSEIYALSDWLNTNNNLAGNYPFDRIFSLVQSVLSDGIVTSDERKELLELFTEFTDPVESNSCDDSITILGNHFCLTGQFNSYDKATLSSMIESQGGFCDKNVTKSTNVLAVGGNGSSDWSCGSYGNKVKKALEYQGKGVAIKIVKENVLLSCLERG